MGRIQEDDKRLICGANPTDFFTMLASCGRIDPDSGDIYVNTACYWVDCEDAEAAIDCNNGAPVDPERFCAANFFTVDSCGHLAFKIGMCEKLLDEI
jgi:hypothetical protein